MLYTLTKLTLNFKEKKSKVNTISSRYSVDPLDDFDDGRDDLTQLIRDSDLNMKVCPRSLDQLNVLGCYTKWVKTS